MVKIVIFVINRCYVIFVINRCYLGFYIVENYRIALPTPCSSYNSSINFTFSGRMLLNTLISGHPLKSNSSQTISIKISNPQDNAFQRNPTLLCESGRAEEPHQKHCSGEESLSKSTYQELHHEFFFTSALMFFDQSFTLFFVNSFFDLET